MHAVASLNAPWNGFEARLIGWHACTRVWCRWIHRASLKKAGVQMHAGVSYVKVDDAGLHLAHKKSGKTSVLPVDTVHYNVLISACARPRRWKEALALVDRMRKRNIARSTVTYNSLLNVLHRSGRWRLALKMLKQMRREKVPPDTVTFSSAIAACGSAGEWQRALLLLPLMAAAGVSPNTITFSSCITACEKKGEWRPALQA